MGFATVLLSSLVAFAATIASAIGGNGFWIAILTFYGAGFGTLALLIAWQLMPGARAALPPVPAPAAKPAPAQV